jgi:hypothetical protein
MQQKYYTVISLISEISVVVVIGGNFRCLILQMFYIKWSRGSSVSIVSDYGLDDRGSIPDRGTGFFL